MARAEAGRAEAGARADRTAERGEGAAVLAGRVRAGPRAGAARTAEERAGGPGAARTAEGRAQTADPGGSQTADGRARAQTAGPQTTGGRRPQTGGRWCRPQTRAQTADGAGADLYKTADGHRL